MPQTSTMNVRPRICLAFVLLGGLTVAGVAPVRAASQRVALSSFQGPGGDRLRAAVIARLPNRLRVVPLGATDRTFGRVDVERADAEWAALGRSLQADAMVEGRVWAGRTWKVRLVVRSARTGAAAGTLVWSGAEPRALMSEVLREAPRKLDARLRALVLARRVAMVRAAPTAARMERADRDEDAGEEEDEVQLERAARASADRPSDDDAVPLLEAAIGPRSLGRSLTFTDNRANVPGYSLPMAPAVGGELLLFPAARVRGWVSQLGLGASWESSLGARTAGRDGLPSHATRHLASSGGLRGRVPLRRASFMLGMDIGQQQFDVSLPGATMSPAVRYVFMRPSLAGQARLDDFALSLSAGYLRVLSASGLVDGRFPRAEVRGFEVGSRLSYAVARELSADLGVEFRRFAYTMNARPGDPMLVGGAADDYLAASLRLAYRVW